MVAPVTAAQAAARKEHDVARFGLGLFLFSKSMFFSALVGAYIVLYKTHADNWPPPGVPELQLGMSSFNTLLILISAVPALLATRAIRRDNQRGTRYGLGLAALLGVLFMGIQILEWVTLHREGLPLRMTYGSCYYVLTGFHAAYVLTGLGILGLVLKRTLDGRYSAERHIGVDIACIWWHFVSAVWMLLFVAIYLIPKL